MSQERQAEVEQIKQQEDVKRALEQAVGKKESKEPVETKQKVFPGTYFVLLVSLGGLYYLLRLNLFSFAAKYLPLLQRFTLGAMAIVLVLAVAKIVDAYLIGRLADPVSRYNLKRILR